MRKVMEAAYAKVNLTLTVTGRRADGYHTIESLFQSVSLCDKLTLEQRERGFWLNETAGIRRRRISSPGRTGCCGGSSRTLAGLP